VIRETAPRRPLSDYSHSPSLTTALAALAAVSSAPDLAVAVLGHVDAGKSTLAGRLLAESGAVAPRDAEKVRRAAAAAGRASFGWAWLLDATEGERARGVTTRVARARLVAPPSGRGVALVDAPGHRDFVPEAAAGAATADAAMLVVDGSEGGFEAGFGGGGAAPGAAPPRAGQTREHAALARALGVRHLVVAVTKLDTCEYREDRFEAVKAALTPFLAGLGFASDAVSYVPACAPAGQNVVSPPDDARLAGWWGGPTVLGALAAIPEPPRATGLPLRMPVADVAPGPRNSTLLTGRIEAGAVAPGDAVVVVGAANTPEGRVVAVAARGLDPAPAAAAGDWAEVAVAGLPPGAVGMGAVLCPAAWPAPLARRFAARVVVPDGAAALLPGAAVTLHAAAWVGEATVAELLALVDKASGGTTRARQRVVARGQAARVAVLPRHPLPLELHVNVPAMGRVALREGGRTVAVGVVEGIEE